MIRRAPHTLRRYDPRLQDLRLPSVSRPEQEVVDSFSGSRELASIVPRAGSDRTFLEHILKSETLLEETVLFARRSRVEVSHDDAYFARRPLLDKARELLHLSAENI